MDNLLNLVRSLSPKEKSQYVKYARQHLSAKDSKKVMLFQLINQQLNGQIKDYKKQAATQFSPSSLPSLKTQLYNQILTSLTQNSTRSIRVELSKMIDEIKILVERGLLKQAVSRIEKAKKIAIENQFHFQYLEISLFHRRIIRQYKTKDVEDLLVNEQRLCKQRIDWINEEFNLLTDYENYFLKTRKNLIQNEDFDISNWDIKKIESFEARAYYYLLEQINFNNQKKYKEGFQSSKKLVEHYEKNKTILIENLPRYLRIVYNFINACIRTGNIEAAEKKLEEIKKINPKNFYDEAQKQSILMSQDILFHFLKKEYGKIINKSEQVKKALNKYAIYIPFERSIGIAYNMGISHFLENDLNGTLEWLNICLEAKDHSELAEKVTGKSFGIYIQGSAMLFRVIVFYEKDNLKLAKNFLSPAAYYLESRKMDKTTLWEILNTLKTIIAKPKLKIEKLNSLHKLLENNPQFEEYSIWIKNALEKEMAEEKN